MKHFRIPALFILFLTSISAFSQSTEQAEMADVLRRDGKIYTVVAGLVIILTTMIVLLIRLDRNVTRLEKQVKKDA